MKFTIFTPFALVCAACVGVIAGERVVWINGGSGIHADHPQKCWSATLNREFAIGEEFNDGDKCELLRCRPDLRFQKRVCSVRQPQPGCTKSTPDPSKPYPDCCGRIQCTPVKIDH